MYQCPNCFRTYILTATAATLGFKCPCGYDAWLDYQVQQNKKQSEAKKESTMLYDLTITWGETYSEKAIFSGKCLTYEQCNSQIQQARAQVKETGDTRDKKFRVIMVPSRLPFEISE